VTLGWNGRNPDEALNVVYHSDAAWNESHYYNATLDNLIETARGIPEVDERREAYGQIQQILIEEVPRIIPVFRPIFAAHRANLHGFGAHPSNWPLFHQAWFDA
jgi:peptide/nickel transport system substrate-binding protein